MVKKREAIDAISDSAESAKCLLEKKRVKIATGTMGLLATAGVLSACGPDGELSPTAPAETAQTVETLSPTPNETEGYGPSGAERDAFVESLVIPANGEAIEVGKKIVEDLNTWLNIGASDETNELYTRESLDPNLDVMNMSIEQYSNNYIGEWRDEFATIFDENSGSFGKLVSAYTSSSSGAMTGYLSTVDNGKAGAVYSVAEIFVSAEEQDATESGNRIIKITYRHIDNAGDTGIVVDEDGTNTDSQYSYYFELEQVGDVLKIVNIE